MSKSYHHGDLREALITETLAMVQADETSLIGFRELARRLDVSRTAPYRHFETVEDLLAAVAEEGFRMFSASLEAVTQKKSMEPRARLLELAEAYLTFALANSGHYRLMFSENFYRKDAFPEVARLAAQSFGFLRDTVSLCLDPEASDKDRDRIATLSWASVHGIAQLFNDGQLAYIRDRKTFLRFACEKLLIWVE